jgi:hypothetical protein
MEWTVDYLSLFFDHGYDSAVLPAATENERLAGSNPHLSESSH